MPATVEDLRKIVEDLRKTVESLQAERAASGDVLRRARQPRLGKRRSQSSDELFRILEERGPLAAELREHIDRSQLWRASVGLRVPWTRIAEIERITKGRVRQTGWVVPVKG